MLKHPISAMMSQAIVDLLEAIDIQEQESKRLASIPIAVGCESLHLRLQECAVG